MPWSLRLLAWGLHSTLTGPEIFWSTHPAPRYLPLLKNNTLRMKGTVGTIFNGLVTCGTARSQLCHVACVFWGKSLSI